MHLDLVSFFEVLGESFDERFGRHILDGVAVCVDEGEVLLKTKSATEHAKIIAYLHFSLTL